MSSLLTILLAPLIGAGLAMAAGRRMPPGSGEIAACLGVAVAAFAALALLPTYLAGAPPESLILFDWIEAGDFKAQWACRLDLLSVVMMSVVASISTLIHIYAIGYMHDDPNRPRFFAYLSLFTFMMLALVSADNFLVLFFGWEGVGLASYLLIGFWNHKESANDAAVKAFIVNRIGDAGFLLGIFAVWSLFGTLDFEPVFAAAESVAQDNPSILGLPWNGLTVAALLLFIGAMGKSAQFLLHTWLPDAMEGPTPVSALIHAATMVTAGVFLVARASPLFEAAPGALDAVAVIGAATALFAATIGPVQNDIKRVIAYSTCSQLGFMFVALGVGAYGIAVFHLASHAFFKALLFLSAGSVIHALHGEQDMRRMGGLARDIPLTWSMTLIGTLSLTGFLFTSGYYSKDAVIEAAYAGSGGAAAFAFILALIASVLTSVYAWRLLFLTFHGQSRLDPETKKKVCESPPIMTVPLIVLAVGSLGFGAVAAPVFTHVDADRHVWQGIFPDSIVAALDRMHHVPAWVVASPSIMAAIGFVIAWRLYLKTPLRAMSASHPLAPLRRFIAAKWGFDELYSLIFVRPALALGRLFYVKGDLGVIDRFGPDGIAARIVDMTRLASAAQTGLLHHYALVMIAGLVGFLTLTIVLIAL